MEVRILCIAIGTYLFLSAVEKSRNFSTFAEIFKSYRIPLLAKSRKVVIGIVLIEFVLALSLLSFNDKMVWVGLCGTLIFISLATIGIAARLLKGEKRFRCGCGKDLAEESSAVWLMLRNLILLAVLSFCLSCATAASLQWSDETLFIYLSGLGCLSIVQLGDAALKAINHIKKWKALG